MRYLYHGSGKNRKKGSRGAGRNVHDSDGRRSGRQSARSQDCLVIEEDTIYEIDQECIECRKKQTGKDPR